MKNQWPPLPASAFRTVRLSHTDDIDYKYTICRHIHTHTHTHTHLSDGCKVEDSCSHTGEREPLWHLADISFCWQSVEEPFFFSHLYNIDQGSTTGNMSVLINVSLLNWNDQSLTRGQCCICKHICLDTLTFHVHPEWDLIKHVL